MFKLSLSQFAWHALLLINDRKLLFDNFSSYLEEVETLDDVDSEDDVDTELDVEALKWKNCRYKNAGTLNFYSYDLFARQNNIPFNT